MSIFASKDPGRPGQAATPQVTPLTQSMADGCPIPMFAIDVFSRVFLWNRALVELTGVPAERVLHRPIDSRLFYSGRVRPVLAQCVLHWRLETIDRLYAAKRVTPSENIPEAFAASDVLTVGGRRRSLYYLAARLRDSRGAVIGAVESIQDVSDRAADRDRLLEHQQLLRALARRLSEAEESMRSRLAADLHDRVGQDLSAAKLAAANLRATLEPAAGAELDRISVLLQRAIEDVSNLTFELSPPILRHDSLGPALQWLAEQYQRSSLLTVTSAVETDGAHLAPELKTLLFRAAGELLHNVRKHADASEAVLRLRRRRGWLALEVIDNGRGFEPGASVSGAGGFGLLSLRERLVAYGGACKIRSLPGQGAAVRLTVPFDTQPRKVSDEHSRIAG